MDINLEIKKRKDSGLFRKRRIVTSPQGAQIDIKGKYDLLKQEADELLNMGKETVFFID